MTINWTHAGYAFLVLGAAGCAIAALRGGDSSRPLPHSKRGDGLDVAMFRNLREQQIARDNEWRLS